MDQTIYAKPGLLCSVFLAALLSPAGSAQAGPVVGCVESSSHAIKVCYDGEGDLELAQSALSSAELVYGIFVDDLGFTPPWRLDDEGTPEEGLYVFLTDMGDWASAAAVPVADVPSTPRSDCAVSLNLNKASGSRRFERTLGQYLGRALFMADDCVEALGDGFSTTMYFLYRQNLPDSPFEDWFDRAGERYFLTFQSNPQLALDYEDPTNPDMEGYVDGHSMFYMYLDERWGDGTGGIFTDIMKAARQDGTVVFSEDGAASLESGENEPDFYDAVDAVLAESGAGFWDAVGEFSMWRVFTGDMADTEHFRYGASIPPVTIYDTFEMFVLPRAGLIPLAAPQETGTAYINVFVDSSMVTDAEDLLQLDMRSSDNMNWHLAALIFNTDGTSRLVESNVTEGRGQVAADDLASAMSVLFAVTNEGDLVHDPDEGEFESDAFIFDVDFYGRPAIESVSPGEVIQGAAGVEIEISGSRLKPGIMIDAGAGIAAEVDAVLPGGRKITAVLDVDVDAGTGLRPLRVYYENGLEAELEDALEVLSGEPPAITSITPDSGFQGRSLNIEIKGQRFQPGMTVAFEGEGITITQVDFVSESSAFAGIDIADAAEPVDRDITVTNPDEKSATLESAFTVLPAQEPDDDNGVGDGCGCTMVR
ncbi:MAG: IPT/TIG domain-containing protein [Pseudomonadota bacterium]